MSLKYNYTKPTKQRHGNTTKIGKELFQTLDSTQTQLSLKTDSLLQYISIPNRGLKYLEASQINRLTVNFGAQLENDLYYNSILQNTKYNKKHLSSEQRYAGARLLYSAWIYQNCYENKTGIRRVLDLGDISNHIPYNTLRKSQRFLYSPQVRKQLKTENPDNKLDKADSLLSLLPETSYLKSFWNYIYQHNDRWFALQYNMLNWTGNSAFGKIGARIKERKKQKATAVVLMSVLQPFDIIVSRSSGHWTAMLTPGHFGHAALWLGKEWGRKNKLKLFNLTIKEGVARISLHEKGMIEALRNGVQMSNLVEYADGEEYVIIRPRNLSLEQKQHISQIALKQLHKEYDFAFDIESPDKIVCTELIYLAYDFISWHVRPFLGRYLLYPDDILESIIDSEQFNIEAFIKDGKIVKSPDKKFLRTLIQ